MISIRKSDISQSHRKSSIASLYKTFEPAQARRIIQRLEIHYTPIHASWLNMAEIEIGIFSRQCLSQSLVSFDEMHRQVNAWVAEQKIRLFHRPL